MTFLRDGQLDRNELIGHTFKALYAMDEVEAEDEFTDADQDADDHVSWSEFVFEFYGLEREDEENILDMDTDTGTEFNRMYARDKVSNFENFILNFKLLISLQYSPQCFLHRDDFMRQMLTLMEN